MLLDLFVYCNILNIIINKEKISTKRTRLNHTMNATILLYIELFIETISICVKNNMYRRKTYEEKNIINDINSDCGI